MTTYNPAGTEAYPKTIHPSDIKALVQAHGKATIGEKELVLKSPVATDPKLQEIIKNPTLSVKPIGNVAANGECEYELSAEGKSVKVKIDCKKCH